MGGIVAEMPKNIKAKLADANVTLIALIDRVRMLDNDLIRLQQKLDTVIELRELKDEETKENEERNSD